jgi:hypothetical protein
MTIESTRPTSSRADIEELKNRIAGLSDIDLKMLKNFGSGENSQPTKPSTGTEVEISTPHGGQKWVSWDEVENNGYLR